MIKIVRYTIPFVILITMLFSCKSKVEKAEEKERERQSRSFTSNPIIWDTLRVDTIQPFAMSGLEATMNLQINMKVLKEYESVDVLNKINREIIVQLLGENYTDTTFTIEKALEKYLVDYFANYGDRMKKYGESQYKAHGFQKISLSYVLSTEILYNEANLISYQITTTEISEKDSIGHAKVKNLQFDLIDGRLLVEEDLFKDDYSEYLNQKLISQVLLDNKQDSIQYLQSQGYWGIQDIESNNNFYVNRNTITYIFNPGEYAESEKGVLKIAIDFDSLQNILKEESPISILIKE